MALSFCLMLALILLALVWVVLPVIVYRVVSSATGSVPLAVVAGATSMSAAVVGLERGFHAGKVFLRKLRRGSICS